MRLGDDGFLGLTYCTNIHPAAGWDEVRASLERHAPALKARLAPDVDFGIGLRLSGAESRELLEGDRLAVFASWLREQGLYVFTLNGFPHGAFHNQPVKADVHAPDWRSEERVAYTLRLVEILARLLPEDLDGSISTNPLAYKAWIDQADRGQWQLMATNVARVAVAMAREKQARGAQLHLDLEPEPDGLLEHSTEVVRFFSDWLVPIGRRWAADELGVSADEAERVLRAHIGVCFDCCHMAVAHERPSDVFERFEGAGIRIGKIQVSSAMDVDLTSDRQAVATALRPFADPIYLHQVTQENADNSLYQYPDLDIALESVDDPRARYWRIHFHTPLFVETYGGFRSTQEWILRTFDEVLRRRDCRILEIETYTWGVLPDGLKRDLTESIGREYEWALDALSLRRI